ncbi:hypothetical protein [Bdellovibrio svalbardensis]|uniref:Uncharacterized protein n=1 Tax=Bdellovibrio svalbardensis TaxID=2972972 RepID=A0ABT6DQL4_9BACT|nr:hypothetical protein [Bdellovibrio svalbardensis]MDG0818116.1 hypothetical protein [Bdellovibrio svalbardensis]
MILSKILILRSPEGEREFSPAVPPFTQKKMGEASENRVDENEILIDKDQTGHTTIKDTVKRFNMTDTSLDTLEDLPPDFMRGEVDVKEQMDMAASAMDSSLRGLQSQSEEDSPRGELGASFRDTPGGIEEVAAKTDEFLASHNLHQGRLSKKRKARKRLKGF